MKIGHTQYLVLSAHEENHEDNEHGDGDNKHGDGEKESVCVQRAREFLERLTDEDVPKGYQYLLPGRSLNARSDEERVPAPLNPFKACLASAGLKWFCSRE